VRLEHAHHDALERGDVSAAPHPAILARHARRAQHHHFDRSCRRKPLQRPLPPPEHYAARIAIANGTGGMAKCLPGDQEHFVRPFHLTRQVSRSATNVLAAHTNTSQGSTSVEWSWRPSLS
jgi:hypothetical protein